MRSASGRKSFSAVAGGVAAIGAAVVAVVAVIAFAAGGGAPADAATQPTSVPANASSPAPTEQDAAEDPPADADVSRTVQLWFTSGEQFHAVDREIDASDSVVRATLDALLGGPRESERDDNIDTQIPTGVTLASVRVDDDMIAHVRLSPGLLKGIPEEPADRDADDTSELRARLGEVTYTVTQFHHIKQARISAGDRLLAAFDRETYERPSDESDGPAVDSGPEVPGTREIQEALANRGYLPQDAVDGKAGERTRQAVLAFQGWEGLARDGVVGPKTSAALRSSSRPSPRGGGSRIEVYRAKGVALAVRDGRVVRAIHVSTGKPGNETPAGTYEVFRKERRSWSVPFSTWLPYASYFNRGIAFHQWPDVPAYPASHGCVRTAAPDAAWLYEFAEIHTKVVVV